MVDKETKLSLQEAYKALFIFLDQKYKTTTSDDIGGMLGSMSLLEDGGTADPAVSNEWVQAVDEALSGNTDINLRFITE